MHLKSIKSVYVACGLTGAPSTYISQMLGVVEQLEQHVQVNRFEMFERMKNPDLEKGVNIYKFNKTQVTQSDAVVVFLDYLSHGAGIETEIASDKLKKLVFFKSGLIPISKMIVDIARTNLAPILDYSLSDTPEQIAQKILKSLGLSIV